MRTIGLGNVAWAALVLMGFALAASRRSLGIAMVLCLLALVFLALGAVQWWRL